MEKKITEGIVIKAIAKRHKLDMFFIQVKDGPTQTVSHHSKIDALAIRLSWSNFGIIGYEIKVSKADFRRDEKWRSYLPMCHQLYFAVAPGVCDVSEIPDNCGLVQLTPKGGIRTVKKAPFRDIPHPAEMYLHLMFKYIGPLEQHDRRYTRQEQYLESPKTEVFRDYLEDKADLKSIGQKASRKLREEINKLERELDKLKFMRHDAIESSADIKLICEALDVKAWNNRGIHCVNAIEQLVKSGGTSLNTLQHIRQINQLSETLLKELDASYRKEDEHG